MRKRRSTLYQDFLQKFSSNSGGRGNMATGRFSQSYQSGGNLGEKLSSSATKR